MVVWNREKMKTYPIKRRALALGRFTDEDKVYHGDCDQTLLQDLDTLVPRRPRPFQRRPPSVRLFVVKLLFGIEVAEIRRPLLASSVRIVVDQERSGFNGRRRPPPEHGLEPRPGCQF